MPSTAVDLYVENHGSVMLLIGASKAGKRWLHKHIPDSALRWGGRHSVVVEPRYMAAIVEGALNDGLEVE